VNPSSDVTEPQAYAILHIGEHVIVLEEPDTFVIRAIGDVSGEEVTGFLDAFERFVEGRRHGYLAIDLRRVGHVTPEARRVSGIRQMPPAFAGVVLFGGSFQQQLVVELATMAGWYLRGRALGRPKPVVMKQESEARAWLAEQRAASDAR
jgi:hypothetical protein